MRTVLLIALLGCQRSELPPVPLAEPTPITTQIVGCAPAGERPRVARTARRKEVLSDMEELPIVPHGWFPYALMGESQAEVAAPIAQQANLALVEKLGDLDLCLTGKTGSVSIMIEVAKTGAITPRVGGIGHRPTEQCIAKIVAGLALPRPAQVVELECGLSAGAAGPLRVSTDAGYRLVELTADAVTLDGKPTEIRELVPSTDTYLVITAPDVQGDRLAKVLAWVSVAPAVLVAVRADGGPPVFVAMAPDRRVSREEPRLGLWIEDELVHACNGDKASLLEAKRVDTMIESALTALDSSSEVVEVAVGELHTAKQLVGATSGVRRAGRDPVLTIGSRCTRA